MVDGNISDIVPLAQWLEHCNATLQVLTSVPAHTCVLWSAYFPLRFLKVFKQDYKYALALISTTRLIRQPILADALNIRAVQ